ncbi:hypothetical protein [Plantactinospora sp. CA-290183]|uniref:hypothetical protein n=1 Tax=Plantactinospora sp. CA-290183 TaxID=3240006 RepID=UPI003D8A9822
MLLLILTIAFAAVTLISFFGGERTANRTIWVVVGAVLLAGLLLVVGTQVG